MTWKVVCQLMMTLQKRAEETFRAVDGTSVKEVQLGNMAFQGQLEGRMLEDHSPKAAGREQLRVCLNADCAFTLVKGQELEALNNRD